MLNGELGAHRHVDALALDLDVATLAILDGIGRAPQPR